ncbi:glycerol uptake facilitator protein [Kitasatospora indigofera]|uniref:Glycerol uptake facilitator protein n=1 Tax=Kitasatospora indigofera TaxID=67307 RepID=A0A919GB04_9ACTN|nr:MIP/aquaporin family protein [Kitasatospora indigofera]GHH81293.1 glycerol uptake facilitator protein [Kitasatospora indigofera]
MTENSFPQKLFAELLGTATLVFIGVGSVSATVLLGADAPFTMAQLGMIALAFALAVVALVQAIGHISGCQINPAVTLALAVTGRMPWREVPGHLAAQFAGAVAGGYAVIAVLGHRAVDVGLGVAAYGPRVGAGHALAAEAIGTFLLVFVVFGAIDARAPRGFAGIAVGFAVFAVILPVAPATGAAVNPARAFGPMLVAGLGGGTVHWGQLPVHLAAELAGGVLAGLAYRVLNRRPAARGPAPVRTAADVEGVLS